MKEINSSEDILEEETSSTVEVKVVDEGESYAVIDEGEEYLAFSVDKLYTNKKENKFRNSFSMKRQPPTLEISSSNGDKVDVNLTKELVQSLIRVLTDVNYAYIGMKKTKKKINFGDATITSFEKFKNIFIKNKLALIQLFFGMTLGIAISKGFLVGVIISLMFSFVALVFSLSQKNNNQIKKDERELVDE